MITAVMCLFYSLYGFGQFRGELWRKESLFYVLSHVAIITFVCIAAMFWADGNLRLKPFAFGALAFFLASYYCFFEITRDLYEKQFLNKKFQVLVKIPLLVALGVIFFYQRLGHFWNGVLFVFASAILLYLSYSKRYESRLFSRFSMFAFSLSFLAFGLYLVPFRLLFVEIIESMLFLGTIWYFYQGLNILMVQNVMNRKLRETKNVF